MKCHFHPICATITSMSVKYKLDSSITIMVITDTMRGVNDKSKSNHASPGISYAVQSVGLLCVLKSIFTVVSPLTLSTFRALVT